MHFFKALLFEIFWMFKQENALMTIFIASIGYAILYPLPYSHQLAREVEIAVVDPDRSALSRAFIRKIDASPNIEVTRILASDQDIEDDLSTQNVRGYLALPRDFSASIYRQESVTVTLAADGAYYLLYATVAEGVANVVEDFNETLRESLLIGSDPALSALTAVPYIVETHNVFNKELGYRNYVIPSVFLIILHQLALIAMATMTWFQVRNPEAIKYYSGKESLAPIARFTAFMSVFFFISIIYVYVLLPLYDVPVDTPSISVISMLLAYFFAVISLGLCIGRLVKHPQVAAILVLLSSMPIVFSAGFVWPSESLPEVWKLLVGWIPAVEGVKGLLAYHVFGDSIIDQPHHVLRLLAEGGVFLLIAQWLNRRQLNVAGGEAKFNSSLQ